MQRMIGSVRDSAGRFLVVYLEQKILFTDRSTPLIRGGRDTARFSLINLSILRIIAVPLDLWEPLSQAASDIHGKVFWHVWKGNIPHAFALLEWLVQESTELTEQDRQWLEEVRLRYERALDEQYFPACSSQADDLSVLYLRARYYWRERRAKRVCTACGATYSIAQ